MVYRGSSDELEETRETMCAGFVRGGHCLWQFLPAGKRKNPDSLSWFEGKTVAAEGLSIPDRPWKMRKKSRP